MNNNDILRRLRYALAINDETMVSIFKERGFEIDFNTLFVYLKKEEEAGFKECPNSTLEHFLDGFIISRRGRKEPAPDKPVQKAELNNNLILKKLRIALEFQQDDMIEVFTLGGMNVSRPELSALFRRKDHKHYKACGDQMLRNFLKGLTVKYRGEK